MATTTGPKFSHIKRQVLLAFTAVVMALVAGPATSTSWAGQPPQVAAAAAMQDEGAGTRSQQASRPVRAVSVEETYASREASASDLQSFKGGDVVIIGSTGLVIILLVILILVVA